MITLLHSPTPPPLQRTQNHFPRKREVGQQLKQFQSLMIAFVEQEKEPILSRN